MKSKNKKNPKDLELKKAKEKRDGLQKNSFSFMVQMIFIIGVPAFLAAYYGKKIGVANETHPKTLIIFSIIAVVFSWSIIIIKFIKINKEIDQNDKKIKELKEE